MPPPSVQRISRIAVRRVLVIDGDPAVTRFVRRALSKDYDIVECHHADAALAAIARGERYDVVLCELWLRGLTGIVLHNAVVPISAELARRFVFVIGNCPTSEQMAFLESVPNLRLAKPFHLDDLRKSVALIVHRASEARAAAHVERSPSSGPQPRRGETLRGA